MMHQSTDKIKRIFIYILIFLFASTIFNFQILNSFGDGNKSISLKELEKYNLNEEISEFTLLINDNYSEHYADACDIKNYSSKFVNPTELATLSLKHFLEKYQFLKQVI